MAVTGVVLLNLGGPDRPESVKPFLLSLFRDPEVLKVPGGALVRGALAWWIATMRTPKVIRNYLEVGWSPLLPRTKAQERALELRLNELARAPADSPAFVVRTAMRYWQPRALEALHELIGRGIQRIVALPLYPQYSKATTGSSLAELRELLTERNPRAELTEVTSYATDPGYVASLARCIEEGIAAARAAPQAKGVEPLLLFSAHGLPQRIVDAGDPYEREVHATRDAVLQRIGWKGDALLSFQSRAGPVRWLGPSTEQTLRRLGKKGVKSVVVVPISFVSDHIETVHEIDVQLGTLARAKGIRTFVRTPALDVRPDFIDALARMVVAHAERGPVRPAGIAHAAER
jgi:ferrochelatase